MRAKLIFNPGAGAAGESPAQLMDVIREMQAWQAHSRSLPGRTGLRPARGGPRCPRERDPHVRGMRR